MKKQNILLFVAVLCAAFLPPPSIAADPASSDKPLKVYILAGQSNMQGQAGWWVLPGLADDPATRRLHDRFVDEKGSPRVEEDVYVAAISGNGKANWEKKGPLTVGFGGALKGKKDVRGRYGARFGPEWGFGVTLDQKLKQPILIIKTAWGGKSLNTDFLSPSGAKLLEGKETGAYYKRMVEHVQKVLADPGQYHPAYDPDQGYELAGFVWFQGWNDMVDGKRYPKNKENRYELYSQLLTRFIRDVREDFKSPKMPFVIGVMGIGGEDFRSAMAAPAEREEFKGNVVAVHTIQHTDKKLKELIDRGWRWQKARWDPENKYAELRKKLTPLQKALDEAKKIKDSGERKAKQREIKARMESIKYTPEERAYLKNNKSSQGFHYLGSPKFFARAGEAFANALIELEKKTQ